MHTLRFAPLVVATIACAQPAWLAEEAPALTNHTQLTFAEDFAKAGEAYFSPDERWLIFQAIPMEEANNASPRYTPNYSMYLAPLNRDSDGAVIGLGEPIRLSAPKSANTCGWFHPTVPGLVLFGSTSAPPEVEDQAGYQREQSDYRWVFHRETEIVAGAVREIIEATVFEPTARAAALARPDLNKYEPLFQRDGYCAEASWSPNGRTILYTWVEPGTNNGDLWVYDVPTQEHTALISEPGYDGGPFFSPDGRFITYRSDRRGDDLLQIFVSELDLTSDGRVTGIKGEYQLTDDQHVNWAPYWTPDGRGLVYTTSRESHFNYELFAIPFDPANPSARHEPVRVTHADGFDGLGVIAPSGRHLLWTAQRGEDTVNRGRASSQLWIAELASVPALMGAAEPQQPAAPRSAGGPPQTQVRFGVKPGNYNDDRPGVLVERVTPGASAEAAGIRAGDRLLTWNEQPITSIGAWAEWLAAHKPGDVVLVGVEREGQMRTVRVPLLGKND
ncbi:MAG: PDZ domain-containing protein [Planctomycetota bacterium]